MYVVYIIVLREEELKLEEYYNNKVMFFEGILIVKVFLIVISVQFIKLVCELVNLVFDNFFRFQKNDCYYFVILALVYYSFLLFLYIENKV